jgi:hypothetical protein
MSCAHSRIFTGGSAITQSAGGTHCSFSCPNAAIATQINAAWWARGNVAGTCHQLESNEIRFVSVLIASNQDWREYMGSAFMHYQEQLDATPFRLCTEIAGPFFRNDQQLFGCWPVRHDSEIEGGWIARCLNFPCR